MVKEVYDTGDVKQVKKRKSKQKLKQEQNDEELRELINTPGGAYFVWRLLDQCGIYRASPNDSQGMAIHEGARRVGQWVLSEIVNIDERLYSKIRLIGSQRDGE